LEEITFNRASPIYGGKIMKTSIVTGCNCPIVTDQNNYLKLYQNNTDQNYDFNLGYQFGIGQNVYVPVNGSQKSATIIDNLGGGLFTIKFSDGTTMIANQNNFAFKNKNTCACCNSGTNVSVSSLNGSINGHVNYVDEYTTDAGAVVGCQKLNGSISNITNTMNFLPGTTDINEINGFSNGLLLIADDGIRYTNGVATSINL
jgi:hypothetical protein